MEAYTYHCQTMHIHTCHQPGSSMEAHMHNARQLGMRYVRFTDHDTRVCAMPGRVHHFDFTFPEEQKAAFAAQGDATVAQGDGYLEVAIAADETPAQGAAVLSAPGKTQSVSLLAEVTVTLGVEAAVSGKAGFAFAVQLSQRPGDHLPAHLCYVQGEPPAHLPPHTVCIPLPAPTDGVYSLPVTADAAAYGASIGGMDNAYNFPAIRVWAAEGGHVTCRVNRYEMAVAYSGEQVLQRQRVLADAIGRRYGIKAYVTTEISGAGQHKNYYGEQVPCIDYEGHGWRVTQEEAIAHVQTHGGIFCYNHPFENGFYKKNKFTAEERPAQVEALANTLIDRRVYGATLMEVGFPKGRCGFTHADHMTLWDRLSLAGVFITGCGDSDSHYSDKGWLSGNNFASWIAAPTAMPHPIADAVFIESMKAGRVYAGDPTRLKEPIDLTAGNVPMGGIIPLEEGDDRPRELLFSADHLSEGWRVRLIDSGICVKEHTVDWAGAYTLPFTIAPTRPVCFGRVEIYDADGHCIGLTNPIYLVRTDDPATLPQERLYTE